MSTKKKTSKQKTSKQPRPLRIKSAKIITMTPDKFLREWFGDFLKW